MTCHLARHFHVLHFYVRHFQRPLPVDIRHELTDKQTDRQTDTGLAICVVNHLIVNPAPTDDRRSRLTN